MRFSFFGKQISLREEQDLGTNGRLKRFIALSVFKNNYIVALLAFITIIVLFALNGYKSINITAEQFTVITLLAKSLIDGMLGQINQLVNYYFERDNKELEDGIKVLQADNGRPEPCTDKEGIR